MRLMMNSRRARPDAVVRDAGEIERSVRIADVHHDLDRNRRQGIEFDVALIEFQHAVVNVAGVAFGAGDGDRLTFLDGMSWRCRSPRRRECRVRGR